MIVKLNADEIGAAITQAVGRQLGLAHGSKVGVKLTHDPNTNAFAAEVDVGDVTDQSDKPKG